GLRARRPHGAVQLPAHRRGARGDAQAARARHDPRGRPRGRDLDGARAQVRGLQGPLSLGDARGPHPGAAQPADRAAGALRDRARRDAAPDRAALRELKRPVFTGIVEAVGRVVATEPAGEKARLRIEAPRVADGTPIGASIAVNGACLTVVEASAQELVFEAVRETLDRTTL